MEFSDIEQLYHKLHQTISQYNVISEVFSSVIYYVNDTKDELSSFDRLKLHNSGSSSQVESIFLKYDFLIIPKNIEKPQTYTVSIRVVSGIALKKRMGRDPFFGAPPKLLLIMGGRTAYSKIDYIDYTVARSVHATIREWFSTIPHERENSCIIFLQRYSHNIPRFLRFATVLLSISFCYFDMNYNLPLHNNDLTYFSHVVMFSFALIYSSYVLSHWCGEYIENSIDSWSPLSYLKFNKGDDLAISQYKSENRTSLIKAGIGIFASILISVATKLVASIIMFHITGS